MKTPKPYIAAAIIYCAFFGMIGVAVYLTGSAWCLWALLLGPFVLPRITESTTKEEKE